MSDRELLELAAKAAGYIIIWQVFEVPFDDFYWIGPAYGLQIEDHDGVWNPLEDDGDALRLAVKLDLDIELTEDSAWANGINVQNYQLFEWHHNDKCAATRRAIVCAAAEIGKEQQ